MEQKVEYITIRGKCKWCKNDIADTKFKREGVWSVDIYPIAEDLHIFEELTKHGIRNVVKTDEDGQHMRFYRETQKEFRGKVTALQPPTVEDKDGKPLPRSTRIGNGSDVTITLQLRKWEGRWGNGAAVRWMALRIDNLAEFNRDAYPDKEQRKAVAIMDKTPVQTW
jgi:hypothetical protein